MEEEVRKILSDGVTPQTIEYGEFGAHGKLGFGKERGRDWGLIIRK